MDYPFERKYFIQCESGCEDFCWFVQREISATLEEKGMPDILIGSGNTEDSAVELMRKVLSDYHNSLNELGKTTVDELCHYKGIGPAKAASK